MKKKTKDIKENEELKGKKGVVEGGKKRKRREGEKEKTEEE